MILNIFITLFLILLNGFFVAAEFAIVKIRKSQIDPKKSVITSKILTNLNSYLSATQLGITLASLALGWIGEETFTELFTHLLDNVLSHESIKSISVILSFMCITIMHIILGELIPKSIAIISPVKTTSMVSYFLYGFYQTFKPFIWVLNFISNKALRLLNFRHIDEHESYSSEELRLLVEEHDELTNKDLFDNMFDFGNKTVKDSMIDRTNIISLSYSSLDYKSCIKFFQNGLSRVPVYNETIDNIIGILTLKDLIAFKDNGHSKLESILKAPFYVPKTKKITDLLKEMRTNKCHLAIVVDEYGGTAGIITLEDILEEIVGEISDETDEELKSGIVDLGQDNWLVDGTVSLTQIEEKIGLVISSETYTTIAGFVLDLFGKIPEINKTKIDDGIQYTVVDSNTKRINKIKIRKINL